MSRLTDFERLALPHMAAANTLAYWLVRSRPDAEDVVQDAYLRAYRGFASFKGEDIRPWLLKIVRNVAYRWHANRKRGSNVISFDDAFHLSPEDEPGEAHIASDEPSPEARMIGQAEQAMVTRALGEIPIAFREILVLREIEGLSYREIAEVAGVPVGTVMSRLARGRGVLREKLTMLTEKEAAK